MDPKRKMSVVRSNLLFEQPFFAHIGFGLNLVEDPNCDAGWTDGISLGYNPAYVDSSSMSATHGLVCEETMHIAEGHLWRMLGLDKDDANRAADLSIFAIIHDLYEIPPELYDPGRDAWCKGKSMEFIYSKIHQKQKTDGTKPGNEQDGGQDREKRGKQRGNGQGEKPLPRGRSEIRQPPKEMIPELKAKWEQTVLNAARIAKEAGKFPAGLEKLVDAIAHPKVNWRIQLRKFMQSFAKCGDSWARPNPKYIPMGMYLASRWSEAIGHVVLFGDTSGSRDYAEARAEFIAEFGSIHDELRPEMTHTAFFDTQVYPGGEFGPDDEIEWKPKGGGGTDFRPIFPWIEKRGIQPACVVILTDGFGYFPDKAPDVPVLWAMTTDVNPPFGEVLRL